MAESSRALIDVSLALVHLASSLRELGCAFAKNDWRVCFGKEEASKDPKRSREDSHDAFYLSKQSIDVSKCLRT